MDFFAIKCLWLEIQLGSLNKQKLYQWYLNCACDTTKMFDIMKNSSELTKKKNRL